MLKSSIVRTKTWLYAIFSCLSVNIALFAQYMKRFFIENKD